MLRIPAGVLIYTPEERTSSLQSNVNGSERGRRFELILGAATNTKVPAGFTTTRCREQHKWSALPLRKAPNYYNIQLLHE